VQCADPFRELCAFESSPGEICARACAAAIKSSSPSRYVLATADFCQSEGQRMALTPKTGYEAQIKITGYNQF
jgi:hypothetical protein